MSSTLHEKIKKLGRTRQEKIQARAAQLIAEELSLRELIVSSFTDLDSSRPSHKDKKAVHG